MSLSAATVEHESGEEASSPTGPGSQRLPTSAHTQWTLAAILIVSAFLRFWRLGYENLWYDELFSVYAVSAGPVEAISRTAADVHPPLYYILQSLLVPILGRSEWAMRFMPAAFGIATVYLLFVAGRRIFDERTGLWVAALFAVAPVPLAYAQEARMYSLLMLCSTLVLIAFASLVSRPDTVRSVLLGLSISALAYTHVYGALAAPVLLIAVLLRPRLRRQIGRRIVLAYAVAAALYLPWALVTLGQAERVRQSAASGEWWIQQPTEGLVGSLLSSLGSLAPATSVGGSELLLALLLIGLTVPFLVSGCSNGDGREEDFVWVLGLSAVFPILVGLLVSEYVVPISTGKYAVVCLPAVYLLVVRGALRLRPWLAPLVLALMLLLAIPAIRWHLLGEPVKGAWRDAVVYAQANQEPRPLMIADGKMAAFNLATYADMLGHEDAVELAFVPQKPEVAYFGPVLTSVSEASLDESLLRLAAPYGRLFVVSSQDANPIDEYLSEQTEWERLDRFLARGTYFTIWTRRAPNSAF